MEDDNRKRKFEEEQGVEGWQTIYCSLVLILVAFFCMLVSYSTVKEEKMQIFIQETFTPFIQSNVSSNYAKHFPFNFVNRIKIGNDGLQINEGGKVLKRAPEVMKVEDDIILLSIQALERHAGELALNEFIKIERTELGFKIIFDTAILFASGDDSINPAFYPYLDEMIELIQKTDFIVKVEGHTDEVPISTPRFASNWDLSGIRAVNIVKYFCEHGKIPSSRLTAVAFGPYHPVRTNETLEGRRANRRVEILFEIRKADTAV